MSVVEKQIKETLKEKQPTLDVFKVMFCIYTCVTLLLVSFIIRLLTRLIDVCCV